MRIAYLANRYPWPSHTFIRREIEALERLGASVVRFSIRPTSPDRDLVDPADKTECGRTRCLLAAGLVRLVAATTGAALRRPWAFQRALRTALAAGWRSDRGVLRHLAYLAEACLLCTWLREADVEHLHAHMATNPAAVAMLCRLVGGPRYSFTIHGPEPFDKATTLALDRKVAHATFVIAISDYARSQLCRWCDRSHWRKIHVVRCGLDEQFLGAPISAVPQTKRLVYVGRLSEQKGLFVLLEAAAILAKSGHDFELILIGDGPLRRELESAIVEAGLDDRVRMIGWASAEDVRLHLRESRALILPSFAEGLPIVLMEAMAMGRPVITTHVGAIPELIIPQVHGWLVPPGNADELARAMGEVLRSPEQRLSDMGRAGAVAVREKHDCAVEAGRLMALFAQAREGPMGRHPDGVQGCTC